MISFDTSIYFVTKVTICNACSGSGINAKYDDIDLREPYPNDFDCPDCKGKGSTEKWIALEVALSELGYRTKEAAATDTK